MFFVQNANVLAGKVEASMKIDKKMTKTENNATKVAFLTLGCKVNFYETEKMMVQFQKLGFEIVDFSDYSDIYIVNTCTVTNMADRKSRQMLHRAKKKNPNSLVVAVGCYVESGGEKLKEDASIDAFFTNADKEHMAERFVEHFSFQIKKAAGENQDVHHERTRAYVKVQDGCNQFCTYCMIPYVRGMGKLRSVPEEKVLVEVKELAAKGYQEVVLTGIHLSSYGLDLSDEINFVKLQGKPLLSLMREVAKFDGIRRIRLGSLEPRIITRDFLRELAEIESICPHFHLSLQSGCDTVLKRMNRHYTSAEYRQKVELIRNYFDKPAITTDVIVGFPGETEEEFETTRNYLRELHLSDVHVFPYSPRTGTKAAAMPEQVHPQEKKRRADCLIADTEQYRLMYGNLFKGKIENVLFEEVTEHKGEAYLVGHNERYVKIGVPLSCAKQKKYKENEIHPVKVEYIF